MLLELEKPKLEEFSAAPYVIQLERVVKKPIVLLPLPKSETSLAGIDKTPTLQKRERTFLGIKENTLVMAAGAVCAVGTVVTNPALLSVAFLGVIAKIGYPHLKKGKLGKAGLHLGTVAGVGLTGAMAMNLYASPAQALFFQQAETFFTTTFGTQSAGAITVIFNVFRAAYVIYLIYSAIAIWTSYNRDDDWMSVAKAPMVIFIGGTLIDIVTTMITT